MTVIAHTATLAHGYTMADVEKFTSIAVNRAWGSGTLDPSDRWDYAWHGVVEALYGNERRPTAADLIAAGGNAITEARNDQFRHHGLNVNTAQPAPSFGKYWHVVASTEGFDDRITEVLALAQVLAVVSPNQYDALAALATFGNQKEAAESLGLSVGTFNARVQAGRVKIKRYWFAPETPRTPPVKDNPDSCQSGHPRVEYGRLNNQGKWHCTLCSRNRSRRRLARQTA